MEWSAAGKIAVVTGGNRGMGLETCRQLGRRGARVVLTSRDPANGESAARRLQDDGLDVRAHQLDVADDQSIARFAGFVRGEFGRLDILINNAAIVRGGDERRERAMRPFTATAAGLREVLATNLIGPFLLCQALIPLMQGSGRVVNVSSGMGQLSEMAAEFPAYRISKAGLNALTGIFASELEGTGIKVIGGWLARFLGRDYAQALQKQLDQGGLLLWVHVRGQAHEQRALDILTRNGAEDVHVHELPGSRDPADNPLTGVEFDPFLPDTRI